MKIKCDVDVSGLEAKITLSAKNVAYATVNAINDTAKQVQAKAQENMRQRFTLRNPQFMLRQAAIIKPFASVSQQRPFAEISVGQKPRLLLSTFEDGGIRHPFVGRNIAIPITGGAARPSWSSPVPGNMRMQALGLKPPLSGAAKKQRSSIKGSTAAETRSLRANFTKANTGTGAWKGKERTYMIPGVGVFQRTGSGKGGTSLIYKFLPTAQLIPRMGFLGMAKGYGEEQFAANLDAALVRELAYKK